MTDYLNSQVLYLFPFIIVPGVIASFVYNFFIRSGQRKYGDYVIELLVFSVFYQGIFFWLIAIVNSPGVKANSVLYNLLMLLTIFIVPALIGYIGVLFSKSKFLRKFTRTASHPTPMAWDYVFSKNLPYYIVFHLKSGKMIAGLYSGDSFASSFSQTQEVYVQELYHVNENGNVGARVERTAGAIIRFDDCDFIEFFSA